MLHNHHCAIAEEGSAVEACDHAIAVKKYRQKQSYIRREDHIASGHALEEP